MSTQGEFFEKPEPARLDLDETSTAVAPREHKRGMKDLSIPKLYYSISEVSRLTGLEQYVLRYWETEFEELRPQKNRAGNRIYSNKDIKFILKIKELLREKRYTIEGAKHILKEERTAERERIAEEPKVIEDPAQLAMPAVQLEATIAEPVREAPKAILTLSEIREMKNALLSLKAALLKR